MTASDTLLLQRIEDLQRLFHCLLRETNLPLPDNREQYSLGCGTKSRVYRRLSGCRVVVRRLEVHVMEL